MSAHADDLVRRLQAERNYSRDLLDEAAAAIEARDQRIDGYQASRDWAIKRLAVALGMEPDTMRPVEYFADQSALRIEALQAEVARLTDAMSLSEAKAIDRAEAAEARAAAAQGVIAAADAMRAAESSRRELARRGVSRDHNGFVAAYDTARAALKDEE